MVAARFFDSYILKKFTLQRLNISGEKGSKAIILVSFFVCGWGVFSLNSRLHGVIRTLKTFQNSAILKK